MIADCRPPAHRGRQRRRISGPFAHDSRTAALAGGRPAGQPWSPPPAAVRTIPAARGRGPPPPPGGNRQTGPGLECRQPERTPRGPGAYTSLPVA